MSNAGIKTANQRKRDSNICQHAQRFQVVELTKQFLGGEICKLLLQFGDINVENVSVFRSKIALADSHIAWGLNNAL